MQILRELNTFCDSSIITKLGLVDSRSALLLVSVRSDICHPAMSGSVYENEYISVGRLIIPRVNLSLSKRRTNCI